MTRWFCGSILLAFCVSAQAGPLKKTVKESFVDGVYTFDAPNGSDPKDAYAKLLSSAKSSVENGERVKAVELLSDGKLSYSVEPTFFNLMGKNAIKPKLEDAYVQRILGEHSFNAKGIRAYAVPKKANGAARQRIHRHQFDEMMGNWTGSTSTSLKWDDGKTPPTPVK
jgi:hypothetical protein